MSSNQSERIHLGAGIWNRGNVLIGIYGQWHGDLSGDLRRTTIDLGLALSDDTVHFRERIPNFRIVPAEGQPSTPLDVAPAVVQGQRMENIGDRTLYWYGLWHGSEDSGVRMVSWPRDRIGMLKPFHPQAAEAISCPIEIEGAAKVYVNGSGLSERSRLRIGFLDEGFRPIEGYSGANSAELTADGFELSVVWKKGDELRHVFHVQFAGVRPEDVRCMRFTCEEKDHDKTLSREMDRACRSHGGDRRLGPGREP